MQEPGTGTQPQDDLRNSGDESGTPAASAAPNRKLLEGLLRQEATGFEFFQAVRLLEGLRPDAGRVGEFTDPAEEAVRFRVHPSLTFPASEIQELDLPRDSEEQPEITANFMGLVGPLGVLPLEYTLLVAREQAAGNQALPDFFNIFEHRLISLFYRAWKKYRPAIRYEEQDGFTDPLTRHLFDCVGLGLPEFRDHLPFDERVLLYYSSLLLAPHRSATALEQLVEDYFGVEASVQQFVGQWHSLQKRDLCEISDDADGFNVLGGGAVVGDEVHDLHSTVRIRIGPLEPEEFDRFLPGRDAHEELAALTRFFGQGQYDFEVQLILKKDKVPPIELGGEQECELGWLTWVRSAPMTRDADETILAL